MLRAQIQLTEAQGRKLRALARRQGVSFSEAVRRCVDSALTAEASRSDAYARARKLVETLSERAGARDLSRRHDEYLDDALG